MKKILLFCALSFFIGLLVGRSTQLNNSLIGKKKAYVEPERHDNSEKIISPDSRDERGSAISLERNESHYKFFDPEKSPKAKIEALLNKINFIDHLVEDGEPNMELIDLYEEILSIDSNNLKSLNRYSSYMIMLGRYEELKL